MNLETTNPPPKKSKMKRELISVLFLVGFLIIISGASNNLVRVLTNLSRDLGDSLLFIAAVLAIIGIILFVLINRKYDLLGDRIQKKILSYDQIHPKIEEYFDKYHEIDPGSISEPIGTRDGVFNPEYETKVYALLYNFSHIVPRYHQFYGKIVCLQWDAYENRKCEIITTDLKRFETDKFNLPINIINPLQEGYFKEKIKQLSE